LVIVKVPGAYDEAEEGIAQFGCTFFAIQIQRRTVFFRTIFSHGITSFFYYFTKLQFCDIFSEIEETHIQTKKNPAWN